MTSRVLIALALIAALAGEASAQGRPNRDRGDVGVPGIGRGGFGDNPFGRPELGSRWNQDDARDAVRAGRHRPLASIIQDLQRRYGGQLVSHDLGERGGRAIYFIRWKADGGNVLDLQVDAESGAVMR